MVCRLKLCMVVKCLSSELLRENKRMLDKSIREIERERQGLQTQEKKLIMEIKKSAKQGQMVCHSYLLLACFSCFIGIACLVFFISLYVLVELLLHHTGM
jgi:uncharacterized membrane protein